MSLKKGITLITRYAWCIVPLVAAGILVLGGQSAVVIFAMTGVLVIVEGVFVHLALRERPVRDRVMASLPLMLFVVLAGGVLLFLERTIIKIPVAAALAFLLAFAHFTLRFASSNPETELRVVARDAYRLIAHASIYCTAFIFFAILFYFGMTSAGAAAGLLLIPLAVSGLRTWFEGLRLNERLMHTIAFQIIFLEAVAILLWLPVPYVFSAFVILLIHFLYSEYVLLPSGIVTNADGAGRLSFVIAMSMLVLLILMTRFR